LTWFSASNLRITDAELKVLAELEMLHTLECATTLDGGRPTRSSEVEVLSLSGVYRRSGLALTDASLPGLAQLTNLRSLSLDGQKITASGLDHLRALPRMTTLSLADTAITERGLEVISSFPGLTSLDLAGTPITDRDLKHLARLENLQTLYLDDTGITDAGLDHVAKLANLTTLYLNDTYVTWLGLKKLAGLKQLGTLSLSHELITDRCVYTLRDLDMLHLLSGMLNEKGQQATSFQDIAFADFTRANVTNDVLECFADSKNIKEIALAQDQLTDMALRQLSTMGLLHTLPHACKGKPTHFMEPDYFRYVRSKVPRRRLESSTLPGTDEEIELLDLSNTPVSDKVIEALRGLKNLKNLRLRRTNVTSDGVHAIQKALGPGCSIQGPVEEYGLRGMGSRSEIPTPEPRDRWHYRQLYYRETRIRERNQ
jgi:Leucine-rich repeat (LRR) protein